MSTHQKQRPTTNTDHRQVHTRLVWAGTLVVLAGIALVGFGLVVQSWWPAVAGLVVAGVGVAVSWGGGILRDAHVRRPIEHELAELASGDKHPGIGTEQEVGGAQARRVAVETSRRTRAFTAAATQRPMPSLFPVGAVGLLVLGVWMSLSYAVLDYPYSQQGWDTALREIGVGVALLLSALRMLLGGRSRIASGIALLTGVVLLFAAVVLPHSATRAMWSEVVSGALVVFFAALTISPENAEDGPRVTPPAGR